MSRLREAYVNAGQGADFAKAARWNIGRLWQEHDDPKLAAAPDFAGRCGLKMNGAGAAVAIAMDAALTARGFPSSTGPYTCGAMFDPEPFHAGDVLELLQAWRARRRTRYTVLTIPPWQAGAFTPELVAQVNGDGNLLVAVQGYMSYPDPAGTIDDLYPADPAEAIDELVNVAKISRARMTKFLPVKSSMVGIEIPYGWSGLLWTFDALPSSPQAAL